MFGSRVHFTELPIEILEKVFLHLPGQDIIKMEAISRQFQDLARGSPVLQYRRELFTASLIDNPHSLCDLDERRRLCREYVHKWSDPANIAKHFREVPLEHQSEHWDPKTPGKNLLATRSHQSSGIDFLHVPSVMSRKPIERWSIPHFPFEVSHYTAYPPENILVVIETKEEFIHIHLLNLLDGSPHRVPPSNVITWALPPGLRELKIKALAMTSSRLMMYVSLLEEVQLGYVSVWRMAVWDWETGDLVFHRSSVDGSELIRRGYQITFLDEFRIVVPYYNRYPGDHELFVFNTLVPQDHPRSLRRFRIPPGYCGRTIRISLDRDSSLGTVNRDGPLIIDPTQAVLVVSLSSRLTGRQDFLILRTRALIEHACSMRADVRIPWSEWGRDAVTVEIPTYGSYFTTTHGARVLVIRSTRLGYRDIRVFDFSRRGGTTLPLSGGSDGGTERMSVFKGGRSCVFAGHDGISQWDPRSLGDSIIPCIMPSPGCSSGVLHVFDLM